MRYVHGLVSLFTQGDTGFRRTRYTAVVEPTLKRFDLRSNWRIFQAQSVPDIITSVLTEQNLTDIRSEICFEHQPREYCVQAGETDLDFIARLVAEEGLLYTFEHRADGHTLVLTDRVSGLGTIGTHTDCPVIYQPIAGGDATEPALHRFHYTEQVRTAVQVQRDYKSGNTIGRVVGETVPAAVPATQANPPIETETEEEKGWWASASPWVHGSLDVLGFVPGLGAIPDLINAGIYAAEGDAVNASLSAVAAIPLAGDALKGSVLIGKGINKAGVQGGREVSERAARTIETKAIDPPSSKGKNGGKFLSNEKCLLRPYKPDTCKAKGLTGHHVVPDRAFRQGPRQGPNRKQIPGGLSESEGLVICVKGKGLTDQHGKIHRAYDPLETALGLSETPPGTTTLLKLEVMGALAAARVTGCNAGLLAAQLRAYHETKGLPSQFRVRADKSGKLIKFTPPGSLGKVGAGDF